MTLSLYGAGCRFSKLLLVNKVLAVLVISVVQLLLAVPARALRGGQGQVVAGLQRVRLENKEDECELI